MKAIRTRNSMWVVLRLTGVNSCVALWCNQPRRMIRNASVALPRFYIRIPAAPTSLSSWLSVKWLILLLLSTHFAPQVTNIPFGICTTVRDYKISSWTFNCQLKFWFSFFLNNYTWNRNTYIWVKKIGFKAISIVLLQVNNRLGTNYIRVVGVGLGQ